MQNRIASYREQYETGQLTLTQIAAEIPCSLGYASQLKRKWGWVSPKVTEGHTLACFFPPKPPPRPPSELDLKMARFRGQYGRLGAYDISDRTGVDVDVVRAYIIDNRWEPIRADRTTQTPTGRIHHAS